MEKHAWYKVFPGAITVTDKDGTVIEMNEGSEKLFENDGDSKIIARKIVDINSYLVKLA